jgi:hypothetical protein
MKLNKVMASAVEEASGGSGFEPLEEGVYTVRLRGVDVREGQKGPYWVWEFEIPDGEEFAGRRFWLNTSLSEAALWKLKEVFGAFGATPATDTDELLGKRVRAVVIQRTIQMGARAGEVTNQIETVKPVGDADVADSKKDDFAF